MVMNVADEVQKSIYELGEDGRLLEMQLEELIGDLEVEELLMEMLLLRNIHLKETVWKYVHMQQMRL